MIKIHCMELIRKKVFYLWRGDIYCGFINNNTIVLKIKQVIGNLYWRRQTGFCSSEASSGPEQEHEKGILPGSQILNKGMEARKSWAQLPYFSCVIIKTILVPDSDNGSKSLESLEVSCCRINHAKWRCWEWYLVHRSLLRCLRKLNP